MATDASIVPDPTHEFDLSYQAMDYYGRARGSAPG